MNILVTGGAGFIGSHVVDEYIRLGHNVWVIDDESSGFKKQVNPSAHYSKCDVANRAQVNRFFRNKRFDVVNHHAAQIDVRHSVADPHFDAHVNILGLLNILELCRQHRVKKILFSASGGTAYGECPVPAKETKPEFPTAPYGVSKLSGEKYIQAYGALYGLRYTIFRYANVYGPRQDPHGEAGVVAIFSGNILTNKIPVIFGSGSQSRDFVYVGDVARANALALTRGHNQVINIGTGKETSVIKLFQTMAKISKFSKKGQFKKARAGELDRSCLNSQKARKKLGWAPRVSLQKGLEKTIQYFAGEYQKGKSK